MGRLHHWYYLKGREGRPIVNANLNLYNYSSSLTQVQFKTNGTVTFGSDIQVESALLSNQENTDVDTGTETVANVAIATLLATMVQTWSLQKHRPKT